MIFKTTQKTAKQTKEIETATRASGDIEIIK